MFFNSANSFLLDFTLHYLMFSRFNLVISYSSNLPSNLLVSYFLDRMCLGKYFKKCDLYFLDYRMKVSKLVSNASGIVFQYLEAPTSHLYYLSSPTE